MGPEPVFGRPPYGLFHESHVSVGDFKVGTGARVELDFLDGGPVVAPFYLLHVEVHDGHVEFLGDDLSAGEYGSVLVEKGYPVVDIGRRGSLVGDESGARLSARGSYRKQVAQGVGLGYAGEAEPGTYLQEQSVEPFVFQWSVYLPQSGVGSVYPQRNGGDVFPVAVVSQHHDDRASAVKFRFEQFRVDKLHAAAHLLVGDVQQFDGLEKVVAEVPVKAALDAAAVMLALVGKGVLQVFPHHVPAVTHNMIYQQVEQVGEDKENPQW